MLCSICFTQRGSEIVLIAEWGRSFHVFNLGNNSKIRKIKQKGMGKDFFPSKEKLIPESNQFLKIKLLEPRQTFISIKSVAE